MPPLMPNMSSGQGLENPMKILILAAIAALSLNLGVAGAQSLSYNAPTHNYYQNNWMNGRG
jgi:hypothetical protein